MAIISPELTKVSKTIDDVAAAFRRCGLSVSEAEKKVSGFRSLAALANSSKNSAKELKNLNDTIEDSIPLAMRAGGAMGDLSAGMIVATSNCDKWSEALKKSGQETSLFTSATKKAGEVLIFAAGAMNAPMYALDKLNSVYKDAKKYTLDYQNATFLSGQALQRTASHFTTASESVKYYNETVNKIAAASGMTRVESQKLFSSFESGFKGIKDQKVLNTFTQMTVKAREMGLTLEEAAKYAEKLNQSGNQFAQFRFGNMSGLNDSLALVMSQMGLLSDEALDAQVAIQQLNSPKDQRGEGYRKEATEIRDAGVSGERTKEAVYLSQATQESFKTMLDYEKALATTIEAHKELIGYMENLGEPLKMATEELSKLAKNLAIFNVSGMMGGGGGGSKGSRGGGGGGGGGGGFFGTLFGSLMGGGLARGGLALGGRGLLMGGGALGLAGLAGYGGYKALQHYGDGSAMKGLGKGANALGLPSLAKKIGVNIPFGMNYKDTDFSKNPNLANNLNDQNFQEKSRKEISGAETAKEPIGWLANEEKLNELTSKRPKDLAEAVQIQKEINSLTGIQVAISDNLGQSTGKVAEMMASVYSDGTGAKEAYQEQLKYIDKSEVKIKQLLDWNIQQASAAHNAAEAARASGNIAEERKQREAEITFSLGVQTQKMQLMAKEAEKFTANIKQATAEIDAGLKFQQQSVSLTQAMADLHVEMRAGLGQSMQDQVNSAKATFGLADMQFKKVKDLKALMASIKGNSPEALRERKQLTLDISKAEIEGINAQKEGFSKMKAFREGYIDAFEESVVGGGGALELLPTQESGVQMFAPTPGLGVQYGSASKAQQGAFQGDPIRMTTAGLSGNLGGYDINRTLGAIGDEYSKRQQGILGGDFSNLTGFLQTNNEQTAQMTEYLQQMATQGISIKGATNRANGGLINGPSGVDKVPAMLTAGEYVVPKDKAGFVQAALEGKVRGFAKGGEATNEAPLGEIAGGSENYKELVMNAYASRQVRKSEVADFQRKKDIISLGGENKYNEISARMAAIPTISGADLRHREKAQARERSLNDPALQIALARVSGDKKRFGEYMRGVSRDKRDYIDKRYGFSDEVKTYMAGELLTSMMTSSPSSKGPRNSTKQGKEIDKMLAKMGGDTPENRSKVAKILANKSNGSLDGSQFEDSGNEGFWGNFMDTFNPFGEGHAGLMAGASAGAGVGALLGGVGAIPGALAGGAIGGLYDLWNPGKYAAAGVDLGRVGMGALKGAGIGGGASTLARGGARWVAGKAGYKMVGALPGMIGGAAIGAANELFNPDSFHNGGITEGGTINTLPGELVIPPPAAQNLISQYEKPSGGGGGNINGSIEIVLNVDGKKTSQTVTLDQLKTRGAKVFHSVVGV